MWNRDCTTSPINRFAALLLIHNLPYRLQERAKYLHLWQGRNKLMDQLPVSGRCVPSQGSEEICNRSDFCYSGRHWTVNVFFISGWAGLCSLANQVRAVHSRLPSTSHQPPATTNTVEDKKLWKFPLWDWALLLCTNSLERLQPQISFTFYYILITILLPFIINQHKIRPDILLLTL